MIAIFVAAALAGAGAWTDVGRDVKVDWPAGWTWTPGGALFDGQLVQAVYGPTGAGAVVRFSPVAAVDLPAAALGRLADVDGALSAERWAETIAHSQTDGSERNTRYLGPSDVAGSRVGRWVFVADVPGEPSRLWWHATWRTPTGFGHLVAWAPVQTADAFVIAMRGVERGLGTVSGWRAPDALLWQAASGCDGPASLDRIVAIAAAPGFAQARVAISRRPVGDRGVAEITAIGGLLERAKRCLEPAAKAARACSVHDRVGDGARSSALRAAYDACLAADD